MAISPAHANLSNDEGFRFLGNFLAHPKLKIDLTFDDYDDDDDEDDASEVSWLRNPRMA